MPSGPALALMGAVSTWPLGASLALGYGLFLPAALAQAYPHAHSMNQGNGNTMGGDVNGGASLSVDYGPSASTRQS